MGNFFAANRPAPISEYKDYPKGCAICAEITPGNPGTFQSLHSKLDSLVPQNFEGIRFKIKKRLSNHFDVAHNVAIRSKYPSAIDPLLHAKIGKDDGYKFFAHYSGDKRVNAEAYPELWGCLTPNGSLIANFANTIGCRLRMKLTAKVKNNEYEDLHATAEYRTNDCTLSTTVIDPRFLKQEGVLLFQYLQAITSRITLGLEVAHARSRRIENGSETSLAGAFRYSTGFSTVSATIGFPLNSGRLCFHQRCSPHLQVGAEWQVKGATKESTSSVFYKIVLPRADLHFTGFVDSNGKVGAVVEKQMYPIQEATLALSGVLDHGNQDLSIGIGLNIG